MATAEVRDSGELVGIGNASGDFLLSGNGESASNKSDEQEKVPMNHLELLQRNPQSQKSCCSKISYVRTSVMRKNACPGFWFVLHAWVTLRSLYLMKALLWLQPSWHPSMD